MSTRSPSGWSGSFSVLILFVLLLFVPVAASGPPPPEPSRAPIEAAVVTEMAEAGTAAYWVILKDQADLTAATLMADWNARGDYVYRTLRAHAAASQASLVTLLGENGARYTSFWIVNALHVTSGTELLDQLSRRSEVKEILAPATFSIPPPAEGKEHERVQAVDWNISGIGADQAWATFGARGEGIVVANIDTGVQFDHPALAAQYRGSAGGSVDHNYNWYDPSNVCGSPSTVPCDNVGHGTHTMGTMIGDDGAANQVGVAPGARWLAAKGCEDTFCTDVALLSAAQWVLAPTDLSGANPRPDLRPHVVNNSWGGVAGDTWYRSMVQAWVAAGIFPAFAVGNSGPDCSSASSPGDYPESYAAGAFDVAGNIAETSGRGPSIVDGGIKPNIAAPGVDVRSSVPGNGYAWYSGTSMASPHVAGTVALMWSVAPDLLGDVATTRLLLDQTAMDAGDSTCGGDASNNNAWGQGMLDAYGAVEQSPRGPTGTLEGTVTNATGFPLQGAKVEANGALPRVAYTDGAGRYSFPFLGVGAYDVTAGNFGYLSGTANDVTVAEGTTTLQDFALTQAPSHAVSGYVFDEAGNAVAFATVTILGTPLPPVMTDASGFYSVASVPEGTYEVSAAADRCRAPQTRSLVVSGDVNGFDFALPRRRDAYGYFCEVQPPAYVEAANDIGLYGDDDYAPVSLPFPFPFYGQTYTTAYVSTNGFVSFPNGSSRYSHEPIPSPVEPNGAIYALWDDGVVDDPNASVRTELFGSAPDRYFVIEWRNLAFCCISAERMDVEVLLFENGRVVVQYRNIDDDARERGASATVGIENEDGSIGLQYSYDEAVIDVPSFAIAYTMPPQGLLTGTVTDGVDGLPVNGATVTAIGTGRSATTDANGVYRLSLPLGAATIEAAARHYVTGSAEVDIAADGATYTQDFTLATARAEVTPGFFSFVVPAGRTRTTTLRLSNTGNADLVWELREVGGGQVTTTSTRGLTRSPGYSANAKTTNGLYSQQQPGPSASTAPGAVLRSWTPTGLQLAWGVGYTGNVWLSDAIPPLRNVEFEVGGTPTGRSYPVDWAGAWPADMAYDAGRNWMCQVNVGGDNGIYCWDPADGTLRGSITGPFPWTQISQRGLAYRKDDDSFYVGGWNDGILYHVAGFGHAAPGTVLGQCWPPDGSISGLAWNGAAGIVWQATNSPTDTIYELDPSTCTVLATLAHPSPNFNGAGLEMDDLGNLWMISRDPNRVYLVESGVAAFADVPWLSESSASGTLPPAQQQTIEVTVDTTGMQPGVYQATLFLRTNSGRNPDIQIPVSLLVPAYSQGVNAGTGAYTDVQGDAWSADQAYTAGGWGYTARRPPMGSTKKPIGGTDDDTLYQSHRVSPTEYKFDVPVPGVYQVELRFAELEKRQPGTRLFDVIIEGSYALPAHDIAYEVGSLMADDHEFFVTVSDGQLNIRFVERRGYAAPIVSAIRVTQRPDR